MLDALRILNLGAVDELVLDLDGGLTVLTGETGVGKTLLVEALHLVLGGADRSVPARDPGAPSRVEAVFSERGGDEVVLARERAAGGRLRASIDGGLASAAALESAAASRCELHGQHEHQVLRTAGAARALLDRAGDLDDGAVRELRTRRRALLAARDELGGSAAERARRVELLVHECDEIDGAALEGPDELDRLLEQAAQVAGVLESREALAAAAAALDGEADEPSAAALLAGALARLPRGASPVRDELSALLEGTRALSRRLLDDLAAVEADPHLLEALDARIARLQALIRKHGTRLGDVVARRAALGAELDALRGDDERAGSVEAELGATERALAEAEARLGAERAAFAARVGADVQGRLAALALPHARFEVVVDGPAGEQVQFRFAGSGVFEPAPLAEAASGGELSRVMLALTLATGAAAGCVVFDEVDAGVGGATARSLASCLAELACDRQVLVVTHLATVAAAAAHHLVVTRGTTPEAAATVAFVTGAARVGEIARMLAGDPSDPSALAHAAALLEGDTAVA